MKDDIIIIRFPELQKKLGNISRPTIRRWEKERGFPKGINMGARAMGWQLNLIDKWIEEQREKAG